MKEFLGGDLNKNATKDGFFLELSPEREAFRSGNGKVELVVASNNRHPQKPTNS